MSLARLLNATWCVSLSLILPPEFTRAAEGLLSNIRQLRKIYREVVTGPCVKARAN